MTMRIASIAAILTLSLGAASPVLAQDVRTFTAWGHEFNVPGAQPSSAPTVMPRDYTAMTTGSVSARSAGPAYRYAGPHAGGPANDLGRH